MHWLASFDPEVRPQLQTAKYWLNPVSQNQTQKTTLQPQHNQSINQSINQNQIKIKSNQINQFVCCLSSRGKFNAN